MSHAHHPAGYAGSSDSSRANQPAGSTRRTLAAVLALTLSFTGVEVLAGLWTGSLALLADAGHMLSDNLSLGLALFAAWIAERPPTPQRSFGFKRMEILAALINGVALVAISLWIFVEAFRRFSHPSPVLGGWMLVVAMGGLLVNLLGARLLWKGRGENLNLQAALWHMLADLLGSIGAIVAACAILLTGWQVADPLISVFIAALILASSWKILRDSVNILLEAAPAGIDAEAVGQRMARQAGVAQVHDLHIWTITSGFPALSAHVLLEPTQDLRRRRLELERLLAQEYGIKHTTLQIDHADAGLQAIYLHSLEPGRICPQAHPETLSRKGHQ